jgi:hypothetical protein
MVKPDRPWPTFRKHSNKEHDMYTPTKLIPTLILALAAVGSASAQTKEDDHKAHHSQAVATASAPTPAADMASKPAAMGGMDGMHEMHEKHRKEMDKIHGTKDPVKRQKLMDKHMKEMREHMDKNGGMDAPMGGKSMQGAASK